MNKVYVGNPQAFLVSAIGLKGLSSSKSPIRLKSLCGSQSPIG
jgi:hypothetical protein